MADDLLTKLKTSFNKLAKRLIDLEKKVDSMGDGGGGDATPHRYIEEKFSDWVKVTPSADARWFSHTSGKHVPDNISGKEMAVEVKKLQDQCRYFVNKFMNDWVEEYKAQQAKKEK
jgi:hypothetical protein